jgi:hypothetical protein
VSANDVIPLPEDRSHRAYGDHGFCWCGLRTHPPADLDTETDRRLRAAGISEDDPGIQQIRDWNANRNG